MSYLDLDTDFASSNIPSGRLISQINSSFFGVGPSLGAKFSLSMSRDFSVDFGSTVSVQFGELRAREATTYIGPPVVSFTNLNSNSRTFELSTNVEAELALSYKLHPYPVKASIGVSAFSIFNGFEKDLDVKVNGQSVPELPIDTTRIAPFFRVQANFGE